MQSYNDVVTRNDANNALIAIGGATVTVYLAGTLTVATIYSDDGVTTKANPFTANSDGTFVFYAPSRKYDVKSSFPGYSDKTITLSSPSLGASMYSSIALSVPNTTAYIIPFNTTLSDSSSFITSLTAFTIPTGISKVCLTANAAMTANSTGDRYLQIYKNGNNIYPGFGGITIKSPTLDAVLSCSTSILNVVAGDYFNAVLIQSSGGVLNTYAGFCSFSIEVIQ